MSIKDSIGLFILLTVLIYHIKPRLIFQDNISRPFGIGYQKNVQKTLFTMTNITIFLATLAFFIGRIN